MFTQILPMLIWLMTFNSSNNFNHTGTGTGGVGTNPKPPKFITNQINQINNEKNN